MENITMKRSSISTEQRARLLDQVRQGERAKGQLRRSLKAGRAKYGPTLFVAADLDRITRAFLSAIEAHTNLIVSLEELRSDSKVRRLAWPRMVLAGLLRELTGASYPAIAMHLGRLDHTTIMHACEVAPRVLAHSPELALAADVTRAALRGGATFS